MLPSLVLLYKGPSVPSRSEKFLTIQLGNWVGAVSVDRLKPYQGQDPVLPAQTSRLRQPPKACISPTSGFELVIICGLNCAVPPVMVCYGGKRGQEIREAMEGRNL